MDDDDLDYIGLVPKIENKKKKKSGGFQSMGLSFHVYKAIIHKGYKVPTPIQRKCIPLIMEGIDVVGMARTGSGKTAAYLIPILERLKAHTAKVGARAIILSPTRELAVQIQKVTKELGKYTDLRSCSIVGGENLEAQFNMLVTNPDIIIATPGRLLHLIVETELDLKSVEYVVFDEADRLFELGYSVQLHEILNRLPSSRQTLLFSATLPKLLVDFAKAGLQEPTLVRLDVDTKISKDLEMAFFSMKHVEKEAALLYILRNIIKVPMTTAVASKGTSQDKKQKQKAKPPIDADAIHQTIIFVSTKHHVEYIANLLIIAGYQVSYIYGSLDQTARNIQINRFRKGVTNLLVVTDVAARGIDIPILENVINFDFVDSCKVFVHRVGRTARAGRRGWAYSLITPEELPYLLDLQLFLGRRLVNGASTTDPDYTNDMTLGGMPKDILDMDIEWVRKHVEDDSNMSALQQVSQNGYKLYCKSRPSAAQESYKRAKEMLALDDYASVHPLLVDQVGAQYKERTSIISSISNFRPHETIFEIGNRGTKKASVAAQIMKQRRETLGKIIESAKLKNSGSLTEESAQSSFCFDTKSDEENRDNINAVEDAIQPDAKRKRETLETEISNKKRKTDGFRDEGYYMSYYQADANTEKGYSVTSGTSFAEQSRSATLDLQGDEKESFRAKKNTLRWDSKKKKFVRGMGIGADNKKLITTESGTKISATFKSGRFNEWQQKSKIHLPRTGEKELAASTALLAAKRYRHNRHTAARPLDPLHVNYERKMKKAKGDPNQEDIPSGKGGSTSKAKKGKKTLGRKKIGATKVRSELKNASQIRKERLEKEKRKAKTGRHKVGARKKK